MLIGSRNGPIADTAPRDTLRVASDLIATLEPMAQTNAVHATCCRVGQIECFIEYRHIASYSLTVLYLKMSKSKEDEARDEL